MMNDSELLNIFRDEVSEYIQALNDGLLKVEIVEGEEQHTLLREMNRYSHSMKGAARAVGLSLIETISHYMEEVYQGALEDKLTLTPDIADTMYDGLDLIQNVMDGTENKEDVIAEVLANLEVIVVQATTEKASEADTPTTAPPTNGKAHQDTLKQDSKEIPAIHLKRDTKPVQRVPRPPATPTPPAETSPPPNKQDTAEVAPTMIMRPAEESIRVSVNKLDQLMAEASELVVARMQGEERYQRADKLRDMLAEWQREWRSVRTDYIRLVRRVQDANQTASEEIQTLFKFLETNQRYLSDANRQLGQLVQLLLQDNLHLATLSDQLQDDVSQLRMMPFETVIGAMQRMVRDLARDTEKPIHFDIDGGTVEIDKTVLDALKDPLLHLLRNAVDHGIETPAEREAAGKAPTGRISLTVEQRGSEIIIRVSDDGHGIDLERIRKKALSKGLLDENTIANLNDEEVRLLIFHSGFSTMDQVTSLSGRGLGMDIVRERVEGLRGRVSIISERGSGTTITLNVPVSLTRIRCILLTLGDEQYAVPSIMVSRMGTFPQSDVYTAEGRNMVNISGHPMPLVSLADILDAPSRGSDDQANVNLVVLQAADRAAAFEIDDLSSEMELVLKPLGSELANTPYIAGASLLGSGEVIIVLDANDLVRKASGAALPRRRSSFVRSSSSNATQQLRVLVVDDSITTRTLEKNILETAGFDVYVAIDGAEAWSQLSEIDVDVIISDVEMPNMTGLQLTQKIKEHPQTKHLPVILLTSLSKPEQREAGLRAGADAYLVKSRFDQSELLETIQSVL